MLRVLVEDYRIDFNPNAGSAEKSRSRSGPRWYSVIAFLVVAALLGLIALGVLASADADEERACYAHWMTEAQMLQATDQRFQGVDAVRNYLNRMHEDCSPDHSWAK